MWFSPESTTLTHLPKFGEPSANVDRDVEHLALRDAAQLGLRMLQLVVQSAQHAARRVRVIVLHEAVA